MGTKKAFPNGQRLKHPGPPTLLERRRAEVVSRTNYCAVMSEYSYFRATSSGWPSASA
ncbi:hypothetical protein ACVWYF_001745 [Hymenobacter sp. UYAg731]